MPFGGQRRRDLGTNSVLWCSEGCVTKQTSPSLCCLTAESRQHACKVSLLQHEMRGDVFPLEKETHGFVIQTRGMQSAVHRMQAQMMLWGTFSTRTPSDHCPFLPAACQLGFYKSDPGDQLCAKCPPHSHSESRAARVCRCDSSFYRAVQDPPSAACTRKYPPTWLCVCCPGTAAFQPQLSLCCRVRGMGFHREGKLCCAMGGWWHWSLACRFSPALCIGSSVLLKWAKYITGGFACWSSRSVCIKLLDMGFGFWVVLFRARGWTQ